MLFKTISKMSSCDCGGYTGPEKGKKLDTQLFPECEGTPCDRDIVKKNRKRKKKKASFNLSKYLGA
jgi:hypothetical protein